MRLFTNQKTWFFIALFFIVANIVLIAGFFVRKQRYHHHSDKKEMRGMHKSMRQAHALLHADILADSLNFSGEQREKLNAFEKTLNIRKDSLSVTSDYCKLAFTRELFSADPDSMKLDSLSVCIGKTTEAYNKIRKEKIFAIRSICNPEQLKQLNAMLQRMANKHFHGGERLK